MIYMGLSIVDSSMISSTNTTRLSTINDLFFPSLKQISSLSVILTELLLIITSRRDVMTSRIILSLFALTLAFSQGFAQTFSVEAYKEFLDQNSSLSPEGLESMHNAGLFKAGAATTFSSSAYAQEIDDVFELTDYEQSLINRNGFMVSERLSYPSFGEALHHVFIKDLPVFISTDAILHAIHKSYDNILVSIEEDLLIPNLDELLVGMRNELPNIAQRYAQSGEIRRSLDDADVYLTVALTLLSENPVNPVFQRNQATINELIEFIDAEQPVNHALFAETGRDLDFSQMTVRGHYTQSDELGRYFRTMMWLGRTEIYLSKPKGSQNPPSDDDVKRQTLLGAILAEAMRDGNLSGVHEKIDRTLRFMIGESDNVTPANMFELMSEVGATQTSDLTADETLLAFQTALANKPYAGQRILSQILFTDPSSPDKITPASAFMLFGQRFVIDSYVMANVVYDKVAKPKPRMLPSSLDVLFALGNDAALHLLEPEMQQYRYAKQLAGLRYLIDSYDSDFWNATLYTGWLGAIRTLNPPADRTDLPRFMQTAAWWQEKMNTQLASWAQLRHDNLLYAKQSYSGGIGCSYPKGYVEPIPAFYDAVAIYASRGAEIFEEMELVKVTKYFKQLEETSRTLEEIARKELAHETLSEEEVTFLQSTLSKETVGCGDVMYTGWYPSLFYGGDPGKEVIKKDLVVADVHTAPTDEVGNMVGWVVHVGTGFVNMAIVTCTDEEGNTTAYAGPVMSYHEHTTTNFQRLTDEDWGASYLEEHSDRPAWTNIYLADKDGGPRGETIALKTELSSVDEPISGRITETSLNTQAFPNPFKATTTISFTVPPSHTGEEAVVSIYDARGTVVAELLREDLPSTSYLVQWDGTMTTGQKAANGVYFYKVQVGRTQASGAIELMR